VIIPADLQEARYTAPEHAFRQVPSSAPSRPHSTVLPTQEELRLAAEILNAGKRVAILVGQGARGAAEEVRQLAELTGAGVAKALLGKDVLSDELSYVTGSIGLLGTRPSYEMMRDCDTLLIVGSNFPYTQFLPDFGQARGIQIDIDGTLIGMRYPNEANLIGDAAETLRALVPIVHRKHDRSWRETIEGNVAAWWQLMERQAMLDAKPVNPMRAVWELSARIPGNAIVTADSGSSTNWYARHLRMRGDIRGSLSGTLATMGPGVPYAIGTKFAHPDRPVIALVGDGAMQMNGLAELITVAKYHRDWPDPRCVICVFHNNDLNQVTWELEPWAARPNSRHPKRFPTSTMPPPPASSASKPSPSTHPTTWEAPGTAPCPPIGRSCWMYAATPRSRPSPARHLRTNKVHDRGRPQRRPKCLASHHSGHQNQSPGIPPRPIKVTREGARYACRDSQLHLEEITRALQHRAVGRGGGDPIAGEKCCCRNDPRR
jgi:pyruvate dehydrogenase (quinone)